MAQAEAAVAGYLDTRFAETMTIGARKHVRLPGQDYTAGTQRLREVSSDAAER